MGGCVFQEVRCLPVHYRPWQVSITDAFIYTQVRAVAVILRERQAVLGQRLLEATQMRRLVVGDDAVEVENNGTDHGLASLVRLVTPL